jgi:hypothetical protein
MPDRFISEAELRELGFTSEDVSRVCPHAVERIGLRGEKVGNRAELTPLIGEEEADT